MTQNLPVVHAPRLHLDWQWEMICANSFSWNHGLKCWRKESPYFKPEAAIAYRLARLAHYMRLYARMLP